MNSLDNLKQIEILDPGKVLESIEMIGEQINQTWQEFKKIKVPKNYKNIDKVLINGMGGSALGGHMLRSVFFDQLKQPVGIINSYSLPASLDKKTLYIISSYSGNTEEPLSTFTAARKKGAKIFGLTSGGKLGQWIKRGKLPGYIFDPIFNPSGQPRMGLGYSFADLLCLFRKLGLIKISEKQLKETLSKTNRLHVKFSVNNPTLKNPAKKLAKQLYGKMPINVASEFLSGNAHVFTNQIEENAKTFSNYFLLPELHHNLVEGLAFPKVGKQNLFFILFESKLYHPRNQIRYKITHQILTKNKIKYSSYQLTATSKFGQSLETLIFGSYVSFYLAMLNNINPTSIPWIDYLKVQLKKSS